ncbi:MAG: aminotransferase class III-fold pyridoxal phosphate-dependent enzyme, partial [Myxococcota bacterium]
IDISAYKFNGPGGEGAPDWVHVVPVADPYRGPFRQTEGDDTAKLGARYAGTVAEALARIDTLGRKTAAFICEAFPSVGGQIVPPDGYLRETYAHVRKAGALCIADEVQTGLGRLGQYFWGFEQQDAQPDIVVLGKPLGNGFPLAAVVTTAEIAASFANGMEFFSTFGGSTVACRVGREVLAIIEDERLVHNAETTGQYLLDGLRALSERHEIIGDVRGLGLFIGVDLVECRQRRTPASEAAHYVVNRMRDRRILIGRDGPAANVLKIRPPMTFAQADADLLLRDLDEVLNEVFIRRD